MNRRTIIVIASVAAVGAVAAYALIAGNAGEAPRELPQAAWSEDESSTAGAEETSATTATALTTTRELAESKRQEGDSSGISAETDAQGDPAAEDDADSGDAKRDAKADVATSLTLEQRKAAYFALIGAEDRAVKEAEEEIPNQGDREQIDAHLALRFRLLEEYEASIREQYDLSDEDIAAILEEGVNNAWPMPPY